MSKVLILGAGASFGHGADGIRPPLANSFFTSEKANELKGIYKPLIDFLNEYSQEKNVTNASLDIEELFGQTESIWQLCDFNWQDRIRRYGFEFIDITPPQMLRSYITDLIYESMTWLQKQTCPYHDILATEYLEKGDVVISFNYDLIMDLSLKRKQRWNEYDGYNVYEANLFNEKESSEIILFKPHGSFNWFRESRVFPENSILNQKEYEDGVRIISLEDALLGKNYHSDKIGSILRSGAGPAQAILDLFNQCEFPEDLKGDLETVWI